MTESDGIQWPWPVSAKALLQEARTAATRAYAPYSRFSVGAALLMADGSVIPGCNVENASYGMTICAERNAVGGMVAAGHLDPVAIAVAGGESGEPCPPCGACRQVLAEFNSDMIVILESPGRIIVMRVNELLPLSFSMTGKN